MPATSNHQTHPTLSSCIGHFYVIFLKRFNRRVVANCIDHTFKDRPKRMRVQTFGDRQGDVVMPHEYEILEKDPQWED